MAIETYAVPDDLRQSRIVLDVAAEGGPWQPVEVAYATSMDDRPHARGGAEGWAHLSTNDPLRVRVTLPDPVGTATLRPSLHDPIPCDVDGRRVCFTVDRPRYLVLSVNDPHPGPDHRWHGVFTLYLLLDPIEPNAPAPGDPGVRVLNPGQHRPDAFALDNDHHTLLLQPGVHAVEGQRVELPAGKTFYLAGGAHLRSYVIGERADGASLRGRGVIDGTGVDRQSIQWRDDGDAGFVFFRRGANITVDGVTIFDSPFWNLVTFGTTGFRARHLKSITWRVNNDGLQPRSCNDYAAERCFLKCADDCVAIKTRRAAGMTSRGLRFTDLVCWNDIPGNAVEIGHTSQADRLEDVMFERIDVVHAAGDPGNSFTVSVHVIDHCRVRNITYRDLRVEGHRTGDFRMSVGVSRYSTDDERGRIDEVAVNGYHAESALTTSRFTGHDDQHRVENVTIENVTFAGVPADPAALRAETRYAADVRFMGKALQAATQADREWLQ
ncbi:MAG: glycosyl hydrolase family 28 protein [Planctomycetota bacterium]